MLNKNQINEKLFTLLEAGVTPFHVVAHVEEELKNAGFTKLCMKQAWSLENGKSYYINHNDSALFAFHVGKNVKADSMIRMAAAHTDHPCLHIKPAPEVNGSGYAQVNVEVYGGPIINTWLDRPLSIAGKIAVKSDDVFKPDVRIYKSEKALMTIPNLAIHMNREVNKGVELNKQTDLLPILGMVKEELEDKDFLLNFLAKELKVAKEDILDYELFVYNTEKPMFIGLEDELISAPRLDDLTSVQALVSGLLDGTNEDTINLIALFNHEEIGSKTKQGADSMLLNHILERMQIALGRNEMERAAGIYNGMLLSVDVAHALHPNKPGKMDITNKPVLNKGFCIKEACRQSYATDAEAIGIVCQICKKNDIPYQKFVNRSDEPGGGTLGSLASSMTPIKTVDIGIPMLAMHSSKECMGSEDELALYQLVTCFFS
ncbi:MAG: M18 family aminopeptidase [Lachnospiraceae bacterium]|jgi:aspartyl aminopeptidase|nr:M18 family aminopeptidase [Lachnospiraceae bacterium]